MNQQELSKVPMRCNSAATVLGSFFASGCIPFAPGTFGTLAAVPFVWVTAQAGMPVFIAVTLLVSIIGIWICGESAKQLGVHDHGGIVWDEVAGLYVTMLLVPMNMLNLVLGFLLFRLFDIWKPFPIRLIDRRLKGGVGIMADDLLAGFYAGAILWLILFYTSG